MLLSVLIRPDARLIFEEAGPRSSIQQGGVGGGPEMRRYRKMSDAMQGDCEIKSIVIPGAIG